jgi:hypothetical protein
MTAQPARLTRTFEPLGGDELAIARSVLYASLFDYPLTLAQLRQTLIESVQTPSQILAAYDRSPALQAAVDHRDGFFFPRGRHDLLGERRRREARSRAFLRRHRVLLALVCALPYVRMVALSGSIAHLNLEGSGDLDLFIVTRGRKVWSTTVLIVVLAKLLGRRRSICANFVIADSTLGLQQDDLFTASQIVHLKPLIGRDVFLRFLAANPFVRSFYPNFHPTASPLLSFEPRRGLGALKSATEWLLTVPSLAAEACCRRAYRAYLRRQSSTWRSPEQVRLEDDCLKLHTRSHRRSVMERFDQAVAAALGRTQD